MVERLQSANPGNLTEPVPLRSSQLAGLADQFADLRYHENHAISCLVNIRRTTLEPGRVYALLMHRMAIVARLEITATGLAWACPAGTFPRIDFDAGDLRVICHPLGEVVRLWVQHL